MLTSADWRAASCSLCVYVGQLEPRSNWSPASFSLFLCSPVDSGKAAFIETLLQRNSLARDEEVVAPAAAGNASDDDVSNVKPSRQLVPPV
jgi:septin family protein